MGPPDRGPVVDLDPNSQEFLDQRFERYAELRESCPVVYDRAHEGFWLVTGYDEVMTVARDTDVFMHKFEPDAPDGVTYEGIMGYPRPEGPAQGLSEVDGPEHHDLRRALTPVFSPAAVERLRPNMERVTTWFLDQVIERGELDLVLDYTSPVPAVLTLQMMGLPCENWQRYAEFFHTMVAHPSTSPEYIAGMAHAPEMIGELLGYAEFRREHPGADVTSLLVRMERVGGPLTDEQIGNVMWNLVAGGIDTTTSLASWGLYHLGTHPHDRRRLVDEPGLLPTAIEEFLRYYSPNESLSRTAARDVELGGRRIRQGDRVWLSWLSANRDANAFDRADEVVVDREPNPHLAFGLGAHRCIGAHLARAETEVLITEVLRRLPDYEIDEARFTPYPGSPLMNGVGTMPATFIPGPRIGPQQPPF